MASENLVEPDSRQGVPWRPLLRHFAEMVAAMLVGMMVLGAVARMGLMLVGWSEVLDRTEVAVVLMAVNMSIGMSVWMRYRRHSWASILEMDAVMVASFVVLLVPFWTGVLSAGAVMMVGHMLMLPAMALVMLRRWRDYVPAHQPAG
ncbi:MAG TPA: hypothetical protein VGD43_03735 [Micromonospora sp.]